MQFDSADEPRHQREVTFLGSAGELVHISSNDTGIDLDDVAELAGQVSVDGADVELDRAGWDILASVPIPVYDDCFATRYPIGDGEVTIYAHADIPGAMTLYRYGAVVDDEVDGEPALRSDGSSSTRGTCSRSMGSSSTFATTQRPARSATPRCWPLPKAHDSWSPMSEIQTS